MGKWAAFWAHFMKKITCEYSTSHEKLYFDYFVFDVYGRTNVYAVC